MTTTKFDTSTIEGRVRTAALRGIINGAEMVRDEAIRSMTMDPKTGRKYPGNPRQSSAPGESPARQTGNLIATMDIQVDAPNLNAAAVARASYASALEFGTERIAPRPFLRAALAKMRPQIVQMVEAEIAFALVEDEFNAAFAFGSVADDFASTIDRGVGRTR